MSDMAKQETLHLHVREFLVLKLGLGVNLQLNCIIRCSYQKCTGELRAGISEKTNIFLFES